MREAYKLASNALEACTTIGCDDIAVDNIKSALNKILKTSNNNEAGVDDDLELAGYIDNFLCNRESFFNDLEMTKFIIEFCCETRIYSIYNKLNTTLILIRNYYSKKKDIYDISSAFANFSEDSVIEL